MFNEIEGGDSNTPTQNIHKKKETLNEKRVKHTKNEHTIIYQIHDKVQLPAKEKVGFICSLSSPNTTLIQFPRKVM